MARSPSTNMNFWARAPLNLVADRVKNSVPPLLRTLRFFVGRQGAELHDPALTTLPGLREGFGGSPTGLGKGAVHVGTRRCGQGWEEGRGWR